MSILNSVLEKRQEIRDIVSSCFYSNPKLFGSVARQEDTDESDIDIMITPTDKATGWKMARAKRKLEHLLERRVDLTDSTTLKELFKPYIEKDLIDI